MSAQPEIETLETALLKAASQSDHQRTATTLLNLLWHVAERRGDMTNLPSSLAEHQAQFVSAILSTNKSELSRLSQTIISAAVLPHLKPSEANDITNGLVRLEALSQELSMLCFLTSAANLWKSIMLANPKIGPLTLDMDAVAKNSWHQLNVGAHTAISFQRTLRVPEDGREYPLPANMGTLPIYRIEDFADKVPLHWLEDGGFFIPLYQREALFIAFKGAYWRPTAAKVAVGRINAVTGKPYDEQIRPHEQDYVIIPDQQWLDGINTGKDLVSQFVAMPLGEGYTIEEQTTDEARHGGFQIVVFEPHPDRFPLENPTETEERRRKAAQNRILKKQKYFISNLDPLLKPIAECFHSGADNPFAISADMQILLLRHIRELMISKLGPEGATGWEDDEIEDFPSRVTQYDEDTQDQGRWDDGILRSAPAPRRKQVEMGISRGGSIKQQILRDHYGVQSWNEAAKRMLNIRIVNSELFQEITGKSPPESPITAQAYLAQGIPWFEQYDETAESVSPANKFTAVKSVAAIDALRGATSHQNQPSVAITPELIKRIQTPTHGERIASFLNRAESSWGAKRYAFAHREATLALQLIQKSGKRSEEKSRALFLTASCNSKLGRYYDAEAEATELIETGGPKSEALAIRAHAYLRLEEYDLSIADSNEAISANASCLLAHEVKAESLLWTDAQDEAYAEAGRALEIQPCSGPALLVRGECLRRMGYLEYAIADLNLALTFGGPDAVAYATRAEALVALRRIDEAKHDLKLALHLIPHYEFARNLLAQITS